MPVSSARPIQHALLPPITRPDYSPCEPAGCRTSAIARGEPHDMGRRPAPVHGRDLTVRSQTGYFYGSAAVSARRATGLEPAHPQLLGCSANAWRTFPSAFARRASTRLAIDPLS